MFIQCYQLFKQLKHGIIILLKCIDNKTKNNNIFTLFNNNYTVIYTLFSLFCTNNSRKKFNFSIILYIVGNRVSMYHKIARCARAPCVCIHVRLNLENYTYLQQAMATALFNRVALSIGLFRSACVALSIGQYVFQGLPY